MRQRKKEIIYDQADPKKAMYFQDPKNQAGRVYSEFVEKIYRYTYDPKDNRIRKQVCYTFRETYPMKSEVWYRVSLIKAHKSSVNVLRLLSENEYRKLFTDEFSYTKEYKSWYSLTERDDYVLQAIQKHFEKSMDTYWKKYENVKNKRDTIEFVQTWSLHGISEDYKPDDEDELIIRS